MVLCIAKPSAGCACIFTALTVAVATGLVCIMSLLTSMHGHIWALDAAVSLHSTSQTANARMASSIDFALASEREALRWEVRNSTLELRDLMLTRMDSLRTEMVESRAQAQREILNALTTQRVDVLDSMARLQSVMHRDNQHLRKELLNTTLEQGKEISELLLDQLKALESIKLRGSEKENEKKGARSAIGEGLWGLISSVEADRDTTAAPEITKKPQRQRTKQKAKVDNTHSDGDTSPRASSNKDQIHEKAKNTVTAENKKAEKPPKKSSLGEGFWGLLTAAKSRHTTTPPPHSGKPILAGFLTNLLKDDEVETTTTQAPAMAVTTTPEAVTEEITTTLEAAHPQATALPLAGPTDTTATPRDVEPDESLIGTRETAVAPSEAAAEQDEGEKTNVSVAAEEDEGHNTISPTQASRTDPGQSALQTNNTNAKEFR